MVAGLRSGSCASLGAPIIKISHQDFYVPIG